MSKWGGVNFQDGGSVMQEYLVMFHDFTLLILVSILSFVSMIIVLMKAKTFIHKTLSAHHGLEFTWTLLPAVVLLAIALPSLTLLFMMEDSSESFLSMKAVGYQWYWHYDNNPDGGGDSSVDSFMVSLNQSKPGVFRLLDSTGFLATPVGIPSRVLVTSGDVLHSWTVPALGVKADACPGRLNELILTPLRSGTYYGQCSEICGSNHSFMPIETKVMASEYWLNP